MQKKVETQQAPKAIGPYSQAVQTEQFLFVSGQLGIDVNTGKLVEGDIQAQTEKVFENLAAILKAAGCSFKNVVRYEVFLKDLSHFAILNAECAKHFDQPIPPARQTIQVAKLPLDGLVEISCIALLNKSTT